MSIQQQTEIDALKREIEALKARLTALESARRPTLSLPKKTNAQAQ